MNQICIGVSILIMVFCLGFISGCFLAKQNGDSVSYEYGDVNEFLNLPENSLTNHSGDPFLDYLIIKEGLTNGSN